MIAKIGKMMTKREDKSFSYEELAAMLKTSPDALKTFEDTYKKQVLDSGALSENFLQNEGRESPRFQPWDDRPTIMVFFVSTNIIIM